MRQARLYEYVFCYHQVDVTLRDSHFLSFLFLYFLPHVLKMKREYSKTRVHPWASLFRATFTKSRVPGDTGARGAPSTGVSSRTGALLSALDRWCLGRWRSSTALLLPSRCFSQLSPSGRGREVLFGLTSTSRLASLGCCSGIGAVLAFFRPVVPHTLVHLCSSLGSLLDGRYLTHQRTS